MARRTLTRRGLRGAGGFAGFAPQAWLHALETIGNDTCVLNVCRAFNEAKRLLTTNR